MARHFALLLLLSTLVWASSALPDTTPLEYPPVGPNVPRRSAELPWSLVGANPGRRPLADAGSGLPSSIDKVGTYYGPISTYEGLKAALEACTFEKELVLLPTMGNSVDAVFQTIAQLG